MSVDEPLTWLGVGVFLLAWSGWLSGAMVLAVWRWARARRALTRRSAEGTSPAPAEPTLLLRPCTGQPPFLADCLRSTGALRGKTPLRIRFSVASAEDPAFATCQRVAAELREQGRDAEAVVLPPAGPNHKAGQVVEALQSLTEPGEILLVVDADVDLTGVYLDAVLSAFADDERSGAIWLPPAERGAPETWGDRASAALLSGSLHAFPLLAGLDPAGLVGKMFALHPRARPSLEPLGELAWYLGEDMEVSRRIRAGGLRVHLHAEVAISRARGRPLPGVIQRFARWFLVIRAQRPALLSTYPLFFGATLPIVLFASAIGLAAGAGPWARLAAAIAVVSTLVSRVGLSLVARTISGARARPLRALRDVALAELVLWLALARTLTLRRVSWAGRTLRLLRSGRLATEPRDA